MKRVRIVLVCVGLGLFAPSLFAKTELSDIVDALNLTNELLIYLVVLSGIILGVFLWQIFQNSMHQR